MGELAPQVARGPRTQRGERGLDSRIDVRSKLRPAVPGRLREPFPAEAVSNGRRARLEGRAACVRQADRTVPLTSVIGIERSRGEGQRDEIANRWPKKAFAAQGLPAGLGGGKGQVRRGHCRRMDRGIGARVAGQERAILRAGNRRRIRPVAGAANRMSRPLRLGHFLVVCIYRGGQGNPSAGGSVGIAAGRSQRGSGQSAARGASRRPVDSP